MKCLRCASDPCACQKQLRASATWIVQSCATPRCFTAIRVKAGDQQDNPVCKWCQSGESHAMNGRAAVDVRLKETST